MDVPVKWGLERKQEIVNSTQYHAAQKTIFSDTFYLKRGPGGDKAKNVHWFVVAFTSQNNSSIYSTYLIDGSKKKIIKILFFHGSKKCLDIGIRCIAANELPNVSWIRQTVHKQEMFENDKCLLTFSVGVLGLTFCS